MTSRIGSIPVRFAVLASYALWIGGFTFYAAVVIPSGHAVLGDHTSVGFITQRVTQWLNVIAVIALAIFSIEAYLARRAGFHRRGVVVLVAALAVFQLGLVVLHPHLDQLLDTQEQAVIDRRHFYQWHRIYLLTASAQWFAAVGYLWYLLRAWRGEDAGGGARS